MIWLHVPKTGGTWLRQVLRAHAPRDWELVEHPEHRSLDGAALDGRSVWSMCRNPWDWHVSLFSFWRNAYVQHLGTFAMDPEKLRREDAAIASLMESSGQEFKSWLRGLLIDERIHWTSMTRALQLLWAQDDLSSLPGTLVRFEDLRRGSLDFLRRSGHRIPLSLTMAILSARVANASPRPATADCYDAESSGWIEEREARLISAVGYERPF